jgi:hypothetical protein
MAMQGAGAIAAGLACIGRKPARPMVVATIGTFGVGVIGYAIDGPLAAAFGTSAVFAVGAVYGLASSAVVLSLRSVRAVRWRGEDQPPVSASSPPREGRRRRLAAPPP